jgi:alkylated DNA repair dioxygenase AlkB
MLPTMNELFPIERKLPEGFTYYENFISIEEERTLLDTIRNIDLKPMLFQGFEAKRKVASFGFDYSFDKGQLTKGKEIPTEFDWLISNVGKHLNIQGSAFAELLVTEYPAGSVINWHRDAPPFDIIAGISLASTCIFKLRPYEKARQNRKAIVSMEVAPRSLYVMKGVSREEWQHCTAPTPGLRYSITLRTFK